MIQTGSANRCVYTTQQEEKFSSVPVLYYEEIWMARSTGCRLRVAIDSASPYPSVPIPPRQKHKGVRVLNSIHSEAYFLQKGCLIPLPWQWHFIFQRLSAVLQAGLQLPCSSLQFEMVGPQVCCVLFCKGKICV